MQVLTTNITTDKEDEEGWETLHTLFQNHEIVFHCANLLPFSEFNEQQLERKRYIGNDIVVVIFKESSTPFDVSVMVSEFNRTFKHFHMIMSANTHNYRCICCCTANDQ